MRPPATAVVVFVTSFFAFTLLPGCLYGPRNGQSSASKSAPILFVGWWFFPSDEVRFFAQNGAGGWDQIPHAPVYTIDTAYRDGAGTDWYRFSAPDVVIPTSYWSASASRVNVAHVKATVGGVPLHTFDVDADGCINSAFPLGGNNVINSCQSTQSPVAAINASCGALDGDCCLGGASCDAGKQCRHDKCVNPCGQLNQTCCAEAPACDALDTVCSGGVCRACGALGQQC